MPLSLTFSITPSVESAEYYGRNTYRVLRLNAATMAVCSLTFFFGLINAIQFIQGGLHREDNRLPGEPFEKWLFPAFQTMPPAATFLLSLATLYQWATNRLPKAINILPRLFLLALYLATIVLTTMGYGYYTWMWNYTRLHEDNDADNYWWGSGNWTRDYEQTNGNEACHYLLITGQYLTTILLVSHIVIDTSAFRSAARRDHVSRELLLEQGGSDAGEEAKVVWSMDPAASSSRPQAPTSPDVLRRPQVFALPSILKNPLGRTSTSTRHSTDNASFWTSIHATSPRASQLTLPPVTPRQSSELPNYSFAISAPVKPETSQSSSSQSTGQTEYSSARETVGDSASSAAEGSLHFSNRLQSGGEQVGTADTGLDLEALISRVTAAQEDRFNNKLEEQAQRFEALISQMYAGAKDQAKDEAKPEASSVWSA